MNILFTAVLHPLSGLTGYQYCGFTAAFRSGRPTELQFYTSLSSVLVQLPVTYFLVGPAQLQTLTPDLLQALVLNGIVFHMQSFTAYMLMGYISPVTYRWVGQTRCAVWFRWYFDRDCVIVPHA